MRIRWMCASTLLLAGLLLVRCKDVTRAGPLPVRPMAVAGSFYPADAQALGKMVDGFVERAGQPSSNDVVALVAPHAGYPYAGPAAGYSYGTIKGRKFDRVVVIAPSHYEAFGFASVYDGAAYSTPLGQVPVDRAFAAKLAGLSPRIKLSGMGHTPTPDRPEHSVEVQLPYLQRLVGQFQLVPVVMGDQSYEAARALGVAVAKLVKGANTLIVASSDLSHYHAYDEAVRMDRKTLNAIEEWDYLSMSRNFESRLWEACGGGPIVATMIAAERLGATEAKVLKYQNSGDTSGDRSRVVGYGAVTLSKGAAAARERSFSLSGKERDELLRIARKSVETAVREHKLYESGPAGLEALSLDRGAFVTLRKNGELRGCIGYTAPSRPLHATVRDVAMMAAMKDSRFSPVTAGELKLLQYEISVLSPLRRVRDVKEIRVGQHGLLIRKGDDEGLLLPQVPIEEHWDRNTFLEQLCRKAGLPKNAWRDPETDIFRFTALVFGDVHPDEPPATPATQPFPQGPDSPVR